MATVKKGINAVERFMQTRQQQESVLSTEENSIENMTALRRQLPVHYRPTFEQEAFKSQLWDISREQKVKLDDLLRLAGEENKDVGRWMKDPCFMAWVARAPIVTLDGQMKALVGLSLTALSDILMEPDPKFNGARVSAARLILEAAKVLQNKQQVVVKDERIARATKEELLEIIKKHSSELPELADSKEGVPDGSE